MLHSIQAINYASIEILRFIQNDKFVDAPYVTIESEVRDYNDKVGDELQVNKDEFWQSQLSVQKQSVRKTALPSSHVFGRYAGPGEWPPVMCPGYCFITPKSRLFH